MTRTDGGVRSRAIIHVGPHKTGTSAFQVTLLSMRNVLEASDNFSVFHAPARVSSLNEHQVQERTNAGFRFRNGKYAANVAFYLQSLESRNFSHHSKVWTEFKHYLDAASKDQRHVVVSSEEFDNPSVNIPLLKGALSAFMRTRIVIVYRPYVSWLVSKWSQINFQQPGPAQALEDFLSTDEIIRHASPAGQHSIALYHRYARHFHDVSLRNHSVQVISEIICEEMDAFATCKAIQQQQLTIVNSNKSGSLLANQQRSCMDSTRYQLLWTMSLGIEAEALEIMGQEMTGLHVTALRLTFESSPIRTCSCLDSTCASSRN